MPRGRPTALTLTLTPTEHATLAHLLRQTTVQQGVRRRAHLVLLVAAGHPIAHAALWAGLARGHAYKWLTRWQAQGLAGLQEGKRGVPIGTKRTRHVAPP